MSNDQQTGGLIPWEKSIHPLYIHHSDQPGVALVSQLLVEDNYTTWEISMSMALTIKNKKGFVDETLPNPKDKPTEESQWERCDVLVKTWLLSSISKEISRSVIHYISARVVGSNSKNVFLILKQSLYFISRMLYTIMSQEQIQPLHISTISNHCGMKWMQFLSCPLAHVRPLVPSKLS